MTTMLEEVDHSRLRVPRQHGEAIFEPSLSAAGELLAANVDRLAGFDCSIAGRPLVDLAAEARRELIERAACYVSRYRDVPPVDASRVVLAGHQPEMFHPGVWLKNFALDHIARHHGAVAVNLLIDNDLLRQPAVAAPAGSPERPRRAMVGFDRTGPAISFEERQILDRDTWASFGGRLRAQVEPFVSHPLIEEFWPLALQSSLNQSNLGQCLAEARHLLEGAWGLETLELPLSHLTDSEPFQWFAVHLMASARHFLAVHNGALAEYRHRHHIRNGAHPVSDLSEQDGWTEAPFWIWTSEDPRRRRLFTRGLAGRLEITDRGQHSYSLPPVNDEGGPAVSELAQLRQAGVKIRPRALITTMFARLLDSDLFLHGIGGAKYDTLTDHIMQQFFRIEPPDFMTLTATLLLPVPRPDVTIGDVRRVEGQLRELRYHPERFTSDKVSASPGASAEISQLASQKAHWLSQDLPRGARLPRHQAINRVNEALQPYIEPLRVQLHEDRRQLVEALARRQILASREYPFCTYPSESLPAALLDILSATP